jgi:hypothetical protein
MRSNRVDSMEIINLEKLQTLPVSRFLDVADADVSGVVDRVVQ